VNRIRVLVAARGVDLVIVIIAVAAIIGTLARLSSERPEDPVLIGFGALAVGLVILVLLVRRQAPFLVPAGTWLASAGLSFLDGRLIVSQAAISIAGMIAAVLLGNLADPRKAWSGLIIVASCCAIIVFNDPRHPGPSLVFVPMLFAAAWLVGYALHERAVESKAAQERAARAERERENAARLAVAEERARITRELHDVVAHAVSVMVLQVGAVRHRMPEGGADRAALQNVERAGRTALTEMRRLLEAMRRDDDGPDLAPQPGLDLLPQLVEDIRAAGLDVRSSIQGEVRELPRGLELSAYRILQEGLTNVLRHAHARTATVRVCYGATDLRLEVTDDGDGPQPTNGSGNGLIGIGERVKIYGGQLFAGPNEAGGFTLEVRLPVDGR
jgi:signal transduction histidine kinase